MDDRLLRRVLASPESIDPDRYVIVKLRLQIDGTHDPYQVCAEMVLNSAYGTLSTLPWSGDSEKPLVLEIAEVGDKYRVEIAFPVEIFGSVLNFPQLLTMAWLPSEYSDTRNLWLDDIQLPPRVVSAIRGPEAGSTGMLQTLRRDSNRPLLSAIVKPRYGGDLEKLRRAANLALGGGADGLVDDELLVDPCGDCSFERRTMALSKLVADLSTNGTRHYYFANVTASITRSIQMIEFAHDAGVQGVIANPFVMGYSAFEYIADYCRSKGLYLVDCSIGSALICLPAGPSGTSISFLCKLSRLMGADASHSGSEGEHWYTPATMRRVIASLTAPIGQIRPTLPVIAGQVNVANVWKKLSRFGPDCMVNAGSGIWGHPDGPDRGAHSIRRILDEVSLDLTQEEAHQKIRHLYSRDKTIKSGINKWGYDFDRTG